MILVGIIGYMISAFGLVAITIGIVWLGITILDTEKNLPDARRPFLMLGTGAVLLALGVPIVLLT